MSKEIINSIEDARAYWYNIYGEPKDFIYPDEYLNVQEKLDELIEEKEKLDLEIKLREHVEHMNEYTIDRDIELHFLITAGQKYIQLCADSVQVAEEERFELASSYNEDNLFTRNYDLH